MKKMILKYVFLGFSYLFLTGCVANGFYEGVSKNTPKEIEKYTDKKFIGVPFLLGLEGSSVKINNKWRATVAHNKPMLIGQKVYYHPNCDFALIRVDDDGDSPTSSLDYKKEKLFHTGYPVMGLYSSHEARFIGDVVNGDVSKNSACKYTATTGTLISGMSGGGVFDADGKLLGVNVGILFGVDWNKKIPEADRLIAPSVFISFENVKDFIYEKMKEEREFVIKSNLEKRKL